MTPTEEAIRQTEANRETNEQPSITDDSDSDDNGSSDPGFNFGISRRTLVLIGVAVVVLLLLYRVRQNGGGGKSNAASEIERALKDDIASTFETDVDGEGSIEIPVNPTDELDKDAAVLDGLRERGKFGAE